MKVAVLGSTGLVGRNVVKLLVQLEQISAVYCPVRTIPDEKESKVYYDRIDFEQINNSSVTQGFEGCSAVICCLGTTIKKAGSKAEQERVDVRLPLTLAAIAKKQGVRHFLCVSAQGADAKSPVFYNRLKGMLEDGLTMMNFDALTLVRPSLLLGKHKERRFWEDLLQRFLSNHLELVPSFFRPVPAETVAAHLVASVLNPPFGRTGPDGVLNRRIIYNRVLVKTSLSF